VSAAANHHLYAFKSVHICRVRIPRFRRVVCFSYFRGPAFRFYYPAWIIVPRAFFDVYVFPWTYFRGIFP
jgi:hypothetical protein